MTERKYNWIIGGLVTVAVLGIVFLIFFDPIMAFLSPKEETPVEPVVEVVAPVEDVKEPEPNPDEAGGAANPNVPDTNIGTGGEPVELNEDGTFTEPEPEKEQESETATPPAGNTGSGTSSGGNTSSGGGSSSGGGTTTYSDGSIGHNGAVVINGITYSGLREFASVEDLQDVRPANGKFTETVSVNGVPYVWTGYEWADYSGFYTEVEVHDLGEWDGTYVGY